MPDAPHDDFSGRLSNAGGRWLVTGAAGFIGSNIVETLIAADQEVVGLDNFATGHQSNLDEVKTKVGDDRWRRFRFIEGDIRDREACARAVDGVDFVLHQAALGSVPRSMADPLNSHDSNVTGFVNLLDAARLARVKRFVYASSSSVYGDEPNLPKREERVGQPLSPYAATKAINEVYAQVYEQAFGFPSIGLRYFNVFGPRQDPNGAYAAVIPKWLSAMTAGRSIEIYGDGTTSRDFCYVANAVQANVRAAMAGDAAQNQVYNVAVGGRTSLVELFGLLRDALSRHQVHYTKEPVFGDFRPGDAMHTEADIGKASRLLGFAPTHDISEGIAEALPWYLGMARRTAAQ
ncbi:SDR family oxidoreductase [Sphingomonas sp.]|uniref:SDR family oxidoreductase n=1 Tax=Sphingomonas sp. TaxID=28214 RepID=UPI00286AF897|nr:SDR family oxidoreductase [Sphingomonas sp.]